MLQRSDLAAHRLGSLLQVMTVDRIAPDEKVAELRAGLAEIEGSVSALRGSVAREIDEVRGSATRDVAARNLAALPEPLRRLEEGAAYPVAVSDGLRALAAEMDRRFGES